MKILSRIKINYVTYIIILSFLLCGYFNYFLIISIIILFHDLGHVLVMLLFKIRINSIDILPFGSVINTNINYNLNSNKLLLIGLAGVINQILLFIIFRALFNYGIINNLSYKIFLNYNKLIIIFNLLPIIPLDGSKILLSLLERVIGYNRCLKIINILSLLSIICFIFINKLSLNTALLGYYLLYKTYEEIYYNKYVFKRFLLERYLYGVNYFKVKKVLKINNIYKDKYNFINNVREGEILKKMFDNMGFF